MSRTSTQGGTGRMPTESSVRGVGVRGVEESFLARRERFQWPSNGYRRQTGGGRESPHTGHGQ